MSVFITDQINILDLDISIRYIIIFFLVLVLILFWILLLIFTINIFKNIKNKNKIKNLLQNDKELQKNIKNFDIELNQIVEITKK